MDGSKYRPKGNGMASAGKRLPYVLLLLLLLALAAAGLSVVVLHKARERRAYAVHLHERDRQIISLRIFLQKEKAINRDMKRKVEELKATTSSLRTQKTDLKTKLKVLEGTTTSLKDTQKELEASVQKKKELEAALTEKDSRIKQMEEKAAGSNPDQMAALMELLQRKEAELEEIRIRFQDYKTTDTRGPNGITSKSTPVQKNNANAAPDIPVVEKVASSNGTMPATEEGNSSHTNSSSVTPTTAEGKSSSNTTVTENRHQKDRSLEEKQMISTTNMEYDYLQEKTSDVSEDIDVDGIYGESHSKKSEISRHNKKNLTDNRVGSHGELDKMELSGNSLDQDSDRVRYNKLLEKEYEKASPETVKPNKMDGNLEKTSKDSLSDANQNKSKHALEEMAGAADVKPKISVNDDGAQQQSKRRKKRRSRSKKKTDTAAINDDGEVTKGREVGAKLIPE